MKIAITLDDNNMISGHFGHCPKYVIYDVQDGKVAGKDFIDNPGHEQCTLPEFLSDFGISLVITGSMGARANQIFSDRGIKTITGASGTPEQVLEKYLKGELTSSDQYCQH
jgi:predicted Fe-Mo cluster-binding NifX family protein